MTLEARLRIARIAWLSDDLPEVGGDTSLETCLSEARQAGISGVGSGADGYKLRHKGTRS